MQARQIFMTGGTGYLGTRLISALHERGHAVKALVRSGSERKLPRGCEVVVGDALAVSSFAHFVSPAHTFVHLLGTPHPAPWKARAFERVDLVSVKAAAEASRAAGIQHFVYLSVAHPAPAMRAYWKIRAEGEAILVSAGLHCTFLRPWYVLGPGHRWAYALVPLYQLAEQFEATRETALRLGLVTLPQMIAALVEAIENPTERARVVEVPEIRRTVLDVAGAHEVRALVS